MRKRILPGLLALALCPAVPLLAQGAGVTTTSRPVRLIRTWEESVKRGDGVDEPRRVEVLFDYRSGVGYQVFYAPDGTQTGRLTLGIGHPSPSRAEIDEAFETVRADPEFAKIFQRFKVVFEGGFLLTEGASRPCGPGSRCLRVFLLSSDRAGTIRQVVVDLVKQRVVYDDFAPGGGSSGARR
ncbi:MAG TPA: hypothetical protein VKG23_16955 [Thermoanaerobaculia bacterium]|nr:hypothetical protein [Thermoanaerobaculia bacterium]